MSCMLCAHATMVEYTYVYTLVHCVLDEWY